MVDLCDEPLVDSVDLVFFVNSRFAVIVFGATGPHYILVCRCECSLVCVRLFVCRGRKEEGESEWQPQRNASPINSGRRPRCAEVSRQMSVCCVRVSDG